MTLQGALQAEGTLTLLGNTIALHDGQFTGRGLDFQASNSDITIASTNTSETLLFSGGRNASLRADRGIIDIDGNVLLATDDLLDNGSGPSGNLTIEARQLFIRNGASVVTTGFRCNGCAGNAGNIFVNASEVVTISGGRYFSQGVN